MHLLRSLAPLYVGRVASFVIETRDLFASQVEDRIERLCESFEKSKPHFIARWNGTAPPPRQAREQHQAPEFANAADVEART